MSNKKSISFTERTVKAAEDNGVVLRKENNDWIASYTNAEGSAKSFNPLAAWANLENTNVHTIALKVQEWSSENL